MKQVLQNLKSGETAVEDVPCPAVREGQVLIRSTCTLLSSGTERMLLEFGRAGWIEKARQQPDKVKMVLDKIKTDGVIPTLDSVMNRLEQPMPLGYCNVGRVLDIGRGVTAFSPGYRVASNGRHAEVVSVPENLCAKVPENVTDEAAAFTVLGAIALQGIRLAAPTLGEVVAVTGLGLVGLMTVQLLRAQGCRVIGIDLDPAKLNLAKQLGADVVDLSRGEDPLSAALNVSRDRGVDAVLITASTTSSEPVHQAAQMCRKRGRIVLVGVAGLELSRADFFEKELTFQVSCSYGPGRYDPNYEDKGIDYPVGYVRWTEQRNFEAVLDMMASGRLDVRPLISHRFPIDDASAAYELLGSAAPSLGILLEYPTANRRPDADVRKRVLTIAPAAGPDSHAVVAFIGAGNYASAILIPAFKKAGARLASVSSNGGVSATSAARRFAFERTSTDSMSAFADGAVNAIVVATRHDTHARLAIEALRAGKHVFIEKPLALTTAELTAIEEAVHAAQGAPIVMVGFNRRFAPHVLKVKALLEGVRTPKTFVITVNAGAVPATHWTLDRAIGGGRIIGEGCHFVDLLRHLSGAPIRDFQGMSIPGSTDQSAFTIRFEDGSIGTVIYTANGHKSYPKERLEVFADGRVLQMDNYRSLRGYGWPGFSKLSLWRQDKGQQACAAAFVRAVETGGPSPIPFEELVEVSRATLAIADALSSS